jgi:hypothetical protein
MIVFDDIDQYIKKVTMIALQSKVIELNSLMDEIVQHDYKTVSEVKGAINSSIDIITAMIKEKELEKAAEQYEADAKADHFTGGLF